ncbi:helix-turn-helix domain-containing protein [Azonexus sp. IMCC34842]|uniref:helix-turn-helix domain-containing protein n=1 Tax=Azonexus sp. IMCC34842 TaxID=3420950 RepID=UPI003D0DEB75
MSPFSILFRHVREKSGLRQKDLAELLSYEQSYLSAIEIGSKGPPTPEFVQKLISVLALNEDEARQMWEAMDASQRKIQIPSDAPEGVFLLGYELRKQIDHLHPSQVEAMLAILRLSTAMKVVEPAGLQNAGRRKAIREQEAQM